MPQILKPMSSRSGKSQLLSLCAATGEAKDEKKKRRKNQHRLGHWVYHRLIDRMVRSTTIKIYVKKKVEYVQDLEGRTEKNTD